VNILPRQARDKHRENFKKSPFLTVYALDPLNGTEVREREKKKHLSPLPFNFAKI